MSSAAALYTNEVLSLATSLATWPLSDNLPLTGSARAPTCGSTIELGVALDAGHRIARIGLRARACAIGQAAAAIFAGAATGQSAQDLATAQAAIERWLEGGADPDWPGFAAITAARAYPARHGAILLPWRAALVALDQPG
ncbi:MAG: iron-sulfur cluster assembly scaffold protein [Novosphingobium sp.]|uniref:iron-sulfur cluster assembly scaffold protein n=1 Tax=Novosphingobium sp. TaxID=1874826 RepID=UPI003C7CF8A9